MEDIQHMTCKTQAADFKQTINQAQADPRSVAGCERPKTLEKQTEAYSHFLVRQIPDQTGSSPVFPPDVHPQWREKIIGSKGWEG